MPIPRWTLIWIVRIRARAVVSENADFHRPAIAFAAHSFNPEAVKLEFADLMRRYRISQVHGDRYGGQWVADSFRRAGIYYAPSEQVKSEFI